MRSRGRECRAVGLLGRAAPSTHSHGWCCCLALLGGALLGREGGPAAFAATRSGRIAPPTRTWGARTLRATTRAPRSARAVPLEAREGPPRLTRARRWRNRAVAAATLFLALGVPRAAWARAVRRVASRDQERLAGYATVGFLGLLFIIAYFNSKKEDSSEDTRIKSEVERLVRLKKEFEEAEASEEMEDDNMMASLRAAQQKMEKKKEEDEAPKDGEASKEEDSKDTASTEESPKKDDADKDKDKDDKEGGEDKPSTK